MGGPVKRFVPDIEELMEMSAEEIWNMYHSVEIFFGSSDSIQYIEKILEQYDLGRQ